MTPENFQHLALEWIGAISAVVFALLALYAAVKAKINEIRINDMHERQNRQGGKIDTLLLQTPPTGQESTKNTNE